MLIVCVGWGSAHQTANQGHLQHCVCVCWLTQGHITWLTKCSCTVEHLEHVSVCVYMCLSMVLWTHYIDVDVGLQTAVCRLRFKLG